MFMFRCTDIEKKLNSGGGVIILGQTTRGGSQKLNPCSLGGGQENDIY